MEQEPTVVEQGRWFDEVRKTDGSVRNHYDSVYRKWQSLSLRSRAKLRTDSKKHLSGDYPIDPLPRVLTSTELLTLRRGVEQRAEAILAFLCEYYRGGKRWQKVIPPFTLRSIIFRHHNESFLGDLNPKTIAFPYGPDIIRDRKGNWRVIEDSAGMLGGIGDLLASRRFLSKWLVKHPILKSTPDPWEFYRKLAIHFTKRARRKNGIVALRLRPYSTEDDGETQRLARIFRSLGIEVSIRGQQGNKLVVRDSGIFMHNPGGEERVGYLILHSGPENHYRNILEKLTISLVGDESAIEKKAFKRIMGRLREGSIQSAILKNKVGTNFSPGIQFINDKAFGVFVDDLVRLYLKQDPILESVPAQTLAFSRNGSWCLNHRALKNVIRQKDRFVIKRVDQDGGGGVWIGPKQTRKQLEQIIPAIRAEPEKYVFQEFEHLSVLEDRIVDLRIHTHVDGDEIITSNTPWGRANWIHGDGKVNLGSNGFTSPVVPIG